MQFREGEVYHMFNRGNNRKNLFFQEGNYLFFLEKVRKELRPVCDILCWCLMPNHFHLLIRANERSAVEKPSFGDKPMPQLAACTGKLLSSYTQAINKQNGTTGSLFQQKTKAKPVTEMMREASYTGSYGNYLLQVVHYIHQNPFRAGIVSRMEDWVYSSFLDYAGLREGTLCNKALLFALTDHDLETFYEDSYAAILR